MIWRIWKTVVFILVIAALVQLVEMVLKKFMPALHRALGISAPDHHQLRRIGRYDADIDNWDPSVSFGTSFGNALLYSLGAGFGFMLAMVLFAGVRSRLDSRKPQMLSGYANYIDRSCDRIGMAFMALAAL